MLKRKNRRSRPSEGRLVCKRIARDKFKSSPCVKENVSQEGDKASLLIPATPDDQACSNPEKRHAVGKVSTSEVLKGMWSNMVSSLKAAVDNLLFNGNDEDGATNRDVLSPSKKRRSSLSGLRTLRKSRRGNKESPLKRWITSHSKRSSSNTVAVSHLSDITPLMHNISAATGSYTKNSKLGSPQFHILNSSPTSLTSFSLSSPPNASEFERTESHQGWRIRNDALRKYYQVSPKKQSMDGSNRLDANTFCPLLDWDIDIESKEPESSINATERVIDEERMLPPPPPPPPLPSLPPPPPPPPPVTPLTKVADQNSEISESPFTSTAVLAGMQRRLRSRMRKKGGQMDGEKKSGCVNVKVSQWAEIQARSRKINVGEFLVLAEEKRQEAVNLVQSLAVAMPTTLPEIKTVCDSLSVAAEWFPGGNKEMKSSIAIWSEMERKIELLTEFLQMTEGMTSLPAAPVFHDTVRQVSWLREEFGHKHKIWGQVLQSNAQSWRSLNLPVSDQLLNSMCQYVVNTAIQHGLLVSTEAKRLIQLHLSSSTRLPEVLKVKCHLQTSIDLFTSATAYFRLEGATDLKMPFVNCIADCALNFMHLASVQYTACIRKKTRQAVVEHFEETLKMLRCLKGISSDMRASQSTNRGQLCLQGYLEMFPSSEELSTALYDSCVTLMEHIASAAQPIISQHTGFSPSSSRQVILWMIFGCKYVNKVLEMLGTERADEKGITSLLSSLQNLETALPTP